jgi:integrase/recombinase XerD
MSTLALELPAGRQETASWEAVAFIASYSSAATRRTYTTQWKLWMDWCADHHLDPLRHPSPARGALRPRTRSPQPVRSHGRAEAGRAHRLLPLLRRRTAARALTCRARPPPQESPRSPPASGSTATNSALLVQAGLSGGNDHVLACLLGLNALRVSEACGADLDDLAIRQRTPHPQDRRQRFPPCADPTRPTHRSVRPVRSQNGGLRGRGMGDLPRG